MPGRVEQEYSYRQPVSRVNVAYDLFAEDAARRTIVELQHVRDDSTYDRFLYYHAIGMVEQIVSNERYKFERDVYTLVIFTRWPDELGGCQARGRARCEPRVDHSGMPLFFRRPASSRPIRSRATTPAREPRDAPMPYAAFFEKFPEVARSETRSLIVMDDPELPPGNYGLLEAYCNELNCDCRRVFLSVFREETRSVEAVIAFGWESRKFYAKWASWPVTPDELDAIVGPCLNLGSPTTRLSDVLLERVKLVLRDPLYVARLARHYAMYKEVIEKEGRAAKVSIAEPTIAEPKVGRNAPCPCGSGKKYKRCHGA